LRHFEKALDELRNALLEMSGLVEAAINRSIHALTERDESAVAEVFRIETRINRMQIEIDGQAARLLALEQPVARDLRLITAAIKINNDLERMGDEAVNIVERAQRIMHEPRLDAAVDIPRMALLTETMVQKSLDAFVKQQPALAREVLESDDPVDELRDETHRELMHHMHLDPRSIELCVSMMFVAHSLERIADHATNIAEDALFLIQGIDVRNHAEKTPQPGP